MKHRSSGSNHPRYLTPERVEILALFVKHHYLTSKQVAALLGATEKKSDGGKLIHRAVRSRLLLMYEAGYLLRTPIMPDESIIRRAPAAEYSYRLSKHGGNIATKGKFLAEKTPGSANHEQQLTNFHLALEGSYPGKVYWVQKHLKRTVNPDAMFALSMDGKTGVYFFLEIERSKQAGYQEEVGHSKITVKLEKYDRYRGSKLCKEQWELFSDFRVILVLKDNQRKPGIRAKNLLQKLAGGGTYRDFKPGWGQTARHPALPYRWIWITTDREFEAAPMSKVFRTPADYTQTAYSLLDIKLRN
jgi:hypothetical protein